MTFGRLYIDFWHILWVQLVIAFFCFALLYGRDTTLELLVQIDKKTDTIQNSNERIIELLEK